MNGEVNTSEKLLSALRDCLEEMEIYSHVGHPAGEKGAAEFNVRFNFAKAVLREASEESK